MTNLLTHGTYCGDTVTCPTRQRYYNSWSEWSTWPITNWFILTNDKSEYNHQSGHSVHMEQEDKGASTRRISSRKKLVVQRDIACLQRHSVSWQSNSIRAIHARNRRKNNQYRYTVSLKCLVQVQCSSNKRFYSISGKFSAVPIHHELRISCASILLNYRVQYEQISISH